MPRVILSFLEESSEPGRYHLLTTPCPVLDASMPVFSRRPDYYCAMPNWNTRREALSASDV